MVGRCRVAGESGMRSKQIPPPLQPDTAPQVGGRSLTVAVGGGDGIRRGRAAPVSRRVGLRRDRLLSHLWPGSARAQLRLVRPVRGARRLVRRQGRAPRAGQAAHPLCRAESAPCAGVSAHRLARCALGAAVARSAAARHRNGAGNIGGTCLEGPALPLGLRAVCLAAGASVDAGAIALVTAARHHAHRLMPGRRARRRATSKDPPGNLHTLHVDPVTSPNIRDFEVPNDISLRTSS
jgi:hypothetical protein